MAITFDDPPLNEVALGSTFLPRPDFLVPYFGAFWQEISNEFPKVAHPPPIVTPGERLDEGSGIFFLPRIWMLSADSATLVWYRFSRTASLQLAPDGREEALRPVPSDTGRVPSVLGQVQ